MATAHIDSGKNPAPDVDALLREVLAGRTERYGDVVEACGIEVALIVAAVVPEIDAIDDIAQEVFIYAYDHLRDYTLGTDFRAWLRAIARNRAMQERTRWIQRKKLERGYRLAFEETAGPRIGQFAAGVDIETHRTLGECLAALNEPSQRLIDRFYFQGATSRQIANEEKRTDSWVRIVLLRARRALAACLREKGVMPHG